MNANPSRLSTFVEALAAPSARLAVVTQCTAAADATETAVAAMRAHVDAVATHAVPTEATVDAKSNDATPCIETCATAFALPAVLTNALPATRPAVVSLDAVDAQRPSSHWAAIRTARSISAVGANSGSTARTADALSAAVRAHSASWRGNSQKQVRHPHHAF